MDLKITNRAVKEFLEKQAIIKGIDDLEISYLVDVTEKVAYGSGELIFPEGDLSNDLYFIYEGEVGILKTDPKTGQQYTLGSLKKGDAFGDLAFLDDEPRSSAIKTLKPTVVLKISKETTYSQSSEMSNIYNKMMKNISKITIKRMRDTNQTFVQNMNEEVGRLQALIDGGKLFIIGVLLVWATDIITSYIENPFMRHWSQALLSSVFLVGVLYQFYRVTAFHNLYAWTVKKWESSFKELMLALALLLGTTLVVFFIQEAVHAIYPNWQTIQFVPLAWNSTLLLYPLYAYLKEFVNRAVIQTHLKLFLNDRKGGKSIFYTALTLSIFNLPFGIGWMLISFIVNYILGYFYNRHPQLLAVTILHVVLGLLLVSWNLISQTNLLRI